ncbi:hypothetical protein BGW80DRAFT_1450340 [Lactifluus volemus]|nr:hypothetical protein BGW80DRAFT_1450340 [Lactifluus volemus]
MRKVTCFGVIYVTNRKKDSKSRYSLSDQLRESTWSVNGGTKSGVGPNSASRINRAEGFRPMVVGTRVAKTILAKLHTDMDGYTHDWNNEKCKSERDVEPVVSDSLDMGALYKHVPRGGARSTTPPRPPRPPFNKFPRRIQTYPPLAFMAIWTFHGWSKMMEGTEPKALYG